MQDNLEALRHKIDEIDNQLLALLVARFEVTEQVGLFKSANNLPAIDAGRETTMFEGLERKAAELGLNPGLATKFWRVITDEVVINHKALAGRGGGDE